MATGREAHESHTVRRHSSICCPVSGRQGSHACAAADEGCGPAQVRAVWVKRQTLRTHVVCVDIAFTLVLARACLCASRADPAQEKAAAEKAAAAAAAAAATAAAARAGKHGWIE
eukprot:1150543-Pelagomonas_calceolata.AAC.6